MRDLLEEKGAFIDLCYIDPPFNSQRNYNASPKAQTLKKEAIFKDTWSNVAYQHHLDEIKKEGLKEVSAYLAFIKRTCPTSYVAYLSMMAIRLYYMWRLLKDTGSLYLHCDQHMSHYLRHLLDYVFGRENFRNELVWHYQTGGVSQRWYARKHDLIFFYAKSAHSALYLEAVKEKRTAKSLRRAQHSKGARIRSDNKHRMPTDVWVMPALNAMAKERLGYPTQKPLALLERIIKASSKEGDVVADFFCGCGTTIDAAQGLNRRWIGVDENPLAITFTEERLQKKYALTLKFEKYTAENA